MLMPLLNVWLAEPFIKIGLRRFSVISANAESVRYLSEGSIGFDGKWVNGWLGIGGGVGATLTTPYSKPPEPFEDTIVTEPDFRLKAELFRLAIESVTLLLLFMITLSGNQ